MERTDSSENYPMESYGNNMQVNEFSLLHDFMEVPDFELFMDMFRGESDVYSGNDFVTNDNNNCYEYGGGVLNQQPFDPNSIILDSVLEEEEEEEEMKGLYIDQEGDKDGDDLEYSSATTEIVGGDDNNTTETQQKRKSGTAQKKGDRSKTLISERRRRGRMKEKLYELRALVPNITKMDKASIIGDAALYVQELQMRAKKLKAQIATLEESEIDKPQQQQQQQPLYQPKKKTRAVNSYSRPKTIAKMEVAQVGERGYYVQLVCNKGKGVAISLYKALESFTSLNVESSNLVTVAETFELTFTLNVGKLEVNSANLKVWVAGAFLNQGFDFKTSLP